MRNIHEVLKQKEADCDRLRHEIEALRVVVPLLDEQAVAERASVLDEKRAEAEPSMGDAEEREVRNAPAEIEADRKGPLTASLNQSGWWRRQGSR